MPQSQSNWVPNRYQVSESEILSFLGRCNIPPMDQIRERCITGPVLTQFPRNLAHEEVRVSAVLFMYHIFVSRDTRTPRLIRTCKNDKCINPWHMDAFHDPVPRAANIGSNRSRTQSAKARRKIERAKERAIRPVASIQAPNHTPTKTTAEKVYVEKFGRFIPAYYVSGEWTDLRNGVIARDKGVCQYCGSPGRQADHILPRRRGGADYPANLVCACADCNGIAMNRKFASFESKKLYILKQRELIAQKTPRPKLRGSWKTRIRPTLTE